MYLTRSFRMLVVVNVFILSSYFLFRYCTSSHKLPTTDGGGTLEWTSGREFLIDTPGCRIKNVEAFNKKLMSSPNWNVSTKCSHFESITSSENGILRLNRTAAELFHGDKFGKCSYEIIRRTDGNDKEFVYEKPVEMFGDVEFTESQFVRVKCKDMGDNVIYTNFHALVGKEFAVEKSVTQSSKENGNMFNVLMIALDSVSRLNSIRRLPTVRNLLLREFGAVEMKGFTRVGMNTFPNIFALLSGHKSEEVLNESKLVPGNEIFFDDFPFIWGEFSRMGYRTLFGEDDNPHVHCFGYFRSGFRKKPTDFYYRPLTLALQKDSSPATLKFGSKTRSQSGCIGSILETPFILRWVTEFMDQSQSAAQPFFAFQIFSRVTHDYPSSAVVLEPILAEFFKELKVSGRLDDTVMFLFGDHGARFGPIRDAPAGEYEENLPMMIVYVPEKLRTSFPNMWEAVKVNTNRLTTVFDVHRTLQHLLNFPGEAPVNRDSTSRTLSLFEEIHESRNCTNADVEPFCSCQDENTRAISNTDETVELVANLTVGFMNEELEMHEGLCAVLTVERVVKAEIKADPDKDPLYSLTLVTNPNDGRFFVKVFHTSKQSKQLVGGNRPDNNLAIRLLGPINRLNWYGSQSSCIKHRKHREWCYCKNHEKS